MANGSQNRPGPGQASATPPKPEQQAPPQQAAPPQQQGQRPQNARPEQGQAQQSPPAKPQKKPTAPEADADRENTAVRPFTQRMSAAISEAARPPQRGESRGEGAALVTGENRAVKPRDTSTTVRPARRARLRLTRIDPWSVTKTSLLLAIAFGIVTIVSVAVVWFVLGAAGVWDSINATVASVLDGDDTAGFDVENYVGTSRILAFTTLVAILNVFLITAVATLAAFMYNLAAALLGGVEVTLAEDER